MELFLGFFFGTLSMIILYNFHWYLITKEKSFLYYSIYKSIMILVILQVTQIIVSNQFLLILSTTILLIFILLFSKEFLSLKSNFHRINQLFNYMIGFLMLWFLYSAISKDYEIFNQPYSLILSPLVIVGFYTYKKGFKPAKYYILSYGIILLFVGLGDLNKFKIIEFYINFPFDFVGNMIGAIILSYAIFVKTDLIIKEKNDQSKILIHQSKLASMGQMLENISHQWRQPLHRISTFIINMQIHIHDKYKEEEYLLNALHQSQLQLEYMSNTINDFTNFNKQDKEKENFLVSSVVDDVYSIIDQTLEKNGIRFEKNIDDDFSIYSYPNELAQVILNLVQNAQDALIQRKIKEPNIKVLISKNKISIEDNAGGIDADIVEYMFEPYFTTKSETSSLGLGLYMSKIILNKYFTAKIEMDKNQKNTIFNIYFT